MVFHDIIVFLSSPAALVLMLAVHNRSFSSSTFQVSFKVIHSWISLQLRFTFKILLSNPAMASLVRQFTLIFHIIWMFALGAEIQIHCISWGLNLSPQNTTAVIFLQVLSSVCLLFTLNTGLQNSLHLAGVKTTTHWPPFTGPPICMHTPPPHTHKPKPMQTQAPPGTVSEIVVSNRPGAVSHSHCTEFKQTNKKTMYVSDFLQFLLPVEAVLNMNCDNHLQVPSWTKTEWNLDIMQDYKGQWWYWPPLVVLVDGCGNSKCALMLEKLGNNWLHSIVLWETQHKRVCFYAVHSMSLQTAGCSKRSWLPVWEFGVVLPGAWSLHLTVHCRCSIAPCNISARDGCLVLSSLTITSGIVKSCFDSFTSLMWNYGNVQIVSAST